jgi:hypothetical protein
MYAGLVAAKRKQWYGARTLFRLVASGTPKRRDKHFDRASTLVEDRVVLFKAYSFEDAIEQAEAEALEYCRRTRYTNIYGQPVRLNFLGATDAFSILDQKPSAGCEVYSLTALIPGSVPDSRVVAERLGKTNKGGMEARHKFIDGRILSKALKATGKEPTFRVPARRKRGPH